MGKAPWPLEPGTELYVDGIRRELPAEHSIELSKAISLKRIADALEKQGGKSHFEQIFGGRS